MNIIAIILPNQTTYLYSIIKKFILCKYISFYSNNFDIYLDHIDDYVIVVDY